MPFTWDDRFNASPGPLDPRFQGVTGTVITPTVQLGALVMVGVNIVSTDICSSIPFTNLLAYRTEVFGVSFKRTSEASVIKTV